MTTATALPDKLLVTRTYEIPTAELFKLAEEMGVHFANQQWELWASRRENPFPWGKVPAFTTVPRTGNQNACAKAGCSVEILDVAISYIERSGGLPKLDRDLYEVDGRRGAHFLKDHSCDVHGHEGIGLARDEARALLAGFGR